MSDASPTVPSPLPDWWANRQEIYRLLDEEASADPAACEATWVRLVLERLHNTYCGSPFQWSSIAGDAAAWANLRGFMAGQKEVGRG